MRELHDRTRDALAACREALHAVEFETNLRRRTFNGEQATARYTVKESLRRVIAVMEAEREPEPDNAESNAVKRFLMEQMELCQYPAPACQFCSAIERLLIAEGYRVEAPAAPALRLVGDALGSQERNS